MILVDDGSTDSSGEICDLLAQRDQRIKVIHKNNGGQSSARNVGLDMASGQFIGFVDSDDTICATMYERLMKISEIDSIVGCYCARVDERGRLIQNIKFGKDREQTPSEYVRDLLLYVGDSSVCTKLFPAAIIKKIRFDENVKNEDFKFMVQISNMVEKYKFIHEAFYYYTMRTGSTTSSFGKAVEDTIVNADWVYNMLSERNLFKEECMRFSMYQRMVYLLMFPKELKKNKREQYNDVVKYMRRHYLITMQNHYMSVFCKITITMQMLVPQLVASIYQARRRRNI